MSRCHDRLRRRGLGFPRVSGDEPMPADTLVVASLFSPRERG